MATLTCEAEYIATCNACKEAVWLLQVVSYEARTEQDLAYIRTLADSQSATVMSKTEGINRRNRHIARLFVSLCS